MNPNRTIYWWRMLAEMVSVVFAVLLALVANEWRQSYHTKQRVREALRNIRLEAEENLHTLRQVSEVQKAYFDLLTSDAVRQQIAGGSEPPSFLALYQHLQKDVGGGLRVTSVNSTSWRSALSTGLVGEFPLPIVLKLTSIQTTAEELDRRFEALESIMYGYRLFVPSETRFVVGQVIVLLHDMLDLENELTQKYGELIGLLEERENP